ncbi:MAG: Crp/Fnr family transcriptional regulator [Chitinophaga sp.]|nr:Crp/Fnr family transcriptional regulator [Chitinophaga sp.]
MEQTLLIPFLQHSGHINAADALQIAEVFEEKQISKNDYFLKAGRTANEYLFLTEGLLRSYVTDTAGNEVTTYFFTQHTVVFEVDSFFNRTAAKENIQAITDCSGWYITYQQLNMLFHAMPAFREFGRYILVKGYTAFKNRTLSMITSTAEERYAQLIQQYPQLFQQAPLKYIASYLGVTDTSLSRIRREFSKK